MTNDKPGTLKKTLKSIAAVAMTLMIICSVMATGINSAFAADEEQAPQPTETPQPTEQQEPTAQPDAQTSQPPTEGQPEELQITQVGGNDCAEGEVIVKFKETVSDSGLMNTLDSVHSDTVQQLSAENLVVSEVPEGETIEGFIDTMEALPNVEYAQPNFLYTLGDSMAVYEPSGYSPEALANDPFAGYQWHLSQIGVFDAWDITMGIQDVRVAVLDTGVDLDHPDLAGQVVAQADVVDNDGSADDDDGHGTHVAGIIAAVANNGEGGAGVAPGASLIAVDVFTTYVEDGVQKWGAFTDDIIEGISYALINDADVINLSLGSDQDDPAFEEAINSAVGSGVPVVCAAGNEATDAARYPSDYNASISVTATNWHDELAYYSNFGAAKDISAPGGDEESYPYMNSYIISTYLGGGYVGMDGTSMAAPVVSGVIALMLSANPALSVAEIKSLLYATADDLGDPGKDIYFGNGRVNAYNAVAAVPPPVHVASVTLSSKSATMAMGDSITLNATVLPDDAAFPRVTWSSSSKAVVTVDRTGKVTAVGGGSAVITATADGVSDTCSITVPKYTVTFDSRGGSAVSPMIKASGSVIPSAPATSMAGYAFAGWYTTPECNTSPVSFPYRVTGNTTLYAKWAVSSFTVTFDSRGGSIVPAQMVPYNTGISQPAAPYMTGYSFAGWYREPACSTSWSFGSDMVQSSITLYAKWQAMSPFLANVHLSAGKLTAAFSRTVYKYKIYLGEYEAGVMITPEREYAGASMTINGKAVTSLYVTLANGRSATVTVRTKYGRTAKTYRFTISRAKSTNNNLVSLTATAGTWSQPFDPNVTSYTITLDENTKSTSIKAAAAAGKLARVSPASKKVSLSNGQSKTIKIRVRAQSGATKYYTVTVKRAASSNANLKSLKASYITPRFSPGITNYSVTMPAKKSSVTISARPAGYKAAVYINGVKKSSLKVSLASGQSAVVKITVKAQAGNTKDYYITVSRP